MTADLNDGPLRAVVAAWGDSARSGDGGERTSWGSREAESADGAEDGDTLPDGRDGKGLVGTGLVVELQPVERG